MAQNALPLSAIIRTKDAANDTKKASRDDYRKAKELEEARKAGTVPAEQDEEGRDINPHIPHYIAAAPWYIGSRGPTLKHQRIPEEQIKKPAPVTEWYKKGVDTSFKATKFRKGACENCGAMTHKKKDCLERPRKIGAKYTGEDIAPDEYINNSIDHDFEGKRDRWNGYDATEYKAVVEEYEKLEEAKRVLKADKLRSDAEAASDEASAAEKDAEAAEKDAEAEKKPDGDVDDEDKYADDMEMPGTKVDSKQRITVRNLRIREDTAKYLLNLDLGSAYYDPKTRSMRENPLVNLPAKAAQATFAGENVIRYSGETTNIAQSQLFAWEAYEKGVDLNLQADPTKAELLRKQYEEKKGEFKKNIEKSVLEKYGGAEHLEAPPKEMLLSQSEVFVQYSRRGDVIKGMDKPVVRSRYEEDIYINNHTTVWGSYWENGSWGYKCCHSFVKMSYCTGMAGILASRPRELEKHVEEPAIEKPTLTDPVRNSVEKTDEVRINRKRSRSSSSSSSPSSSSSSSSDSSSSESEDEEEERKRKVKEAMRVQEEEEKAAERLLSLDERRRPYNSMAQVKKLTDEEIEAYERRKIRSDDPMAGYLNK